MNGIDQIDSIFQQKISETKAALMPYFTLGFPDEATCLKIIEAISKSGADIIELGIPFSDPIADGPTIQHSTQIALSNGINVQKCLEMVGKLRKMNIQQPILLMGYFNPILAYGIDKFVSTAKDMGVNGFIIPDLPPEEAVFVEKACNHNGCALVYLATPTTTPDRLAYISSKTTGFLYLVSLRGVTGERRNMPAELESFIQRVKSLSKSPVVVGFGISTPDQARKIAEFADGIIIGSVLINHVINSKSPVETITSVMESYHQALSG